MVLKVMQDLYHQQWLIASGPSRPREPNNPSVRK